MAAERIPAAYAALEADYEILREIGRGGTALVYLARERASGAEVAIKLIRAKYLEDEEAIARFAREARFVAQVDHPNIVPVRAVLDLGASGMALVMAHVTGRTLKQVIRDEHPIAPERVERMLRDVAAGLGAAHALGIVHRDVKPENIFIDESGRALLADFGLARSMSGDTQLTMAGVAIGTPAYMAPEQIDGGQLDARGDIYSLGLVAWEMLTGHRPWDGESLYAILYHQKYEQLPDVRDIRHEVPDRVADAIAGSIEKERERRWQNVDELVAALDGNAAPRHSTTRSPVTTDTVRFARPTTPLVAAPLLLEDADRRPQAERMMSLAEIAAELKAAEYVVPRPPGRRFVVAGGAIAAVVVTALVATAVQGRVNDRRAPAHELTMPVAAAGDVGKTMPASGHADSAAKGATAGSTAASVTSRGAPAGEVPGRETRGRDSAVAITEPTTKVTAVSPPAVAARSPHESSSSSTEGRPRDGAARSSAEKPTAAEPTTGSSNASPAAAPVAPTATPPVAPSAPTSSARATIVAGGLHTCLVGNDGRAFCWGGNDHGQLGTGTSGRATAPAPVGSDQRFSTLAAGLSHSCGVARDGSGWCWGENDHGQLGDRSNTAHNSPVRVVDSHLFRTIVAGAAHTCGLDRSGVAWCWGSNAHGQLGDSTTGDASMPVAVAGARQFKAIAAGWNFTCGLDVDGHAFCWGDDGAGELGDNATGVNRRIPFPVSGSLSFVSIAAGNAHACGVTLQGDVYCWGKNANGQLGDGTTSDHSAPVRVKASSRFVAVTAGAVHSCAITAGGDAFCWGSNTYGQLGDGGTTDHAVPAEVSGGHVFASLRAFGSHTCGATVSGEAFCWGYNLDGQVGDGTRTHRTKPVYVEPPAADDRR